MLHCTINMFLCIPAMQICRVTFMQHSQGHAKLDLPAGKRPKPKVPSPTLDPCVSPFSSWSPHGPLVIPSCTPDGLILPLARPCGPVPVSCLVCVCSWWGRQGRHGIWHRTGRATATDEPSLI